MTEQKKLSALAKKILEVLNQSDGQWLSRHELGIALNRPGKVKRTNAHDVKVLNDLIECGLIEQELRVTGTVKSEYQYRILQSEKVS